MSGCTQAQPEAASPPPVAAALSAAVPAQPAEDVTVVITRLEHEWVNAIVKKDTAALERLLGDDFSGTSADAHSYTKTMAINELKSSKYVVAAMKLDEIAVNEYGDVAVAFTSQEEKSTYGGKNTSGHYHFTDVWVKRDGRWQAVASHGTRYATGH
jgi:ketosteroid isomerase-like protein